jgi:hypothetical protein
MVKDLSRELPPNAMPDRRLDSMTLSATEWSTVAPPDPQVGSHWTIPEGVGHRFFALLSPTDAAFGDPAEVTDVRFVGRVASVRDGIAYLAYGGQIAGTHHGTQNEGMVGKEFSSALKLIGAVGAYETGPNRCSPWCGLVMAAFGTGTPRPTFVKGADSAPWSNGAEETRKPQPSSMRNLAGQKRKYNWPIRRPRTP